ncbi:hypothetical protein B0H16DRAFT_1733644 [Mycena metata]|uniref:Cyclin N-terminal domain-containing protein n=1 Tax=Mycena metata TaxID=1033252 RepID=A0AAD7HXR6_9AGAR|nr:hypothetical protein B0H16DRAFT_1733644 [Mycena metata]
MGSHSAVYDGARTTLRKKTTTAIKKITPQSEPPRNHSDNKRITQMRRQHGANIKRSKLDRYFGKKWIAHLSANFITHLFASNKFPSRNIHRNTYLPIYIAYAIRCSSAGDEAVYAALILLHRLKGRYPEPRKSSGHKLFIAAFMVASKFLYDESYKNSTWMKIAQNLYDLPELNELERGLCLHLEWDIAVDTSTITTFRSLLNRDFHIGTSGPYPTYPTETAYKCK